MKKIIYLLVVMVLPLGCSKSMQSGNESFIIQDDLLLPFGNCDFSKDEWKMKVVIDENDFSTMDSRIPRKKVLVCSDVLILQEIKNSWSFKITEGDLATVTSSLLLQKNGETVFSSGIVLSKGSGGLQSEAWGWAPVIDKEAFYRCLNKFHEDN